jgi:hypothetical protein
MSRCDSCGVSDRQIRIENALNRAKVKADEVKKPQAICEEQATGAIYVFDAWEAFQQHHYVLQVISGFEITA